jgi:hypothetical protein
MAAKNRTRHVLGDLGQKALLSSQNLVDAYRLVTDSAVYMASCSFVNEANRLLTALWSRHAHCQNVWLADRAMTVLWHHSANFPPNVPFRIETIEAIEVAHRAYMSGNRWSPEFLNNERACSPGQLATKQLAKAMVEICPNGIWMPTREADLQGIADFEAFQGSGFCHGYDAFSTLTNLAELCAKYGRVEDAERYIMNWHEEFVRYSYNFTFECLPAYPHASQLLLTGLLTKVFELDAESCEHYLQEWLEIVVRRFGGGSQLIYEKLDWGRLLERITHCATEQGNVESPRTENQELCHDSASQEELDTLEARLMVGLPDDYRDFLRSSNGFEPTDHAAVRVKGTADVDWLRNVYSDVIEIWSESGVGVDLERSLLIGDLDGEQQLLLVPSRSRLDSDDCKWECWFFAHWVPGEVRFSSFRAWFEHVLLKLESDNAAHD